MTLTIKRELKAHCPICGSCIGRPIGSPGSKYERDMRAKRKIAYCPKCGRGYNGKEIDWRGD